MRIAYVTTYDSSNVHSWSGLGQYIFRSLQDSGFQLAQIGNLTEKKVFRFRLKEILYTKLLSKRYMQDREPAILKNYASQLEVILETLNYDLVFSPGTIPIAYLQTEKPIVFWADATFAGMINFYPAFSNLCLETIRMGNRMEQSALSKCRLAIYSSQWAADSAIRHYEVDPAKINVVPFGANINCDRNFDDINRIVHKKSFDTCKLLFVGVDWFRKGGDIALAVADRMNKRGIKTEMHIVGYQTTSTLPSFVKQYGFISKDSQEGRRLLDQLMTEAHFLLLPSRAECYGVVFAEASSFGLPSLATRVGGITTAVRDGKNGQTFPLDESPEKYCNYIEHLMSFPEMYKKLALSSFTEYIERLNWHSAGIQVANLIEQFC